jgi:hypothetical protein
MKKAQIITLSLCAVGALALLAAGFVLVRGISRFGKAREAEGVAKSKLANFYREPVFPSNENVKLEQSNKESLDNWFDALAAVLREGNVISKERSPSAFKTRYLEKVIERLEEQAQSAGTELPEEFGFGFELYVGTPTLPRPDDVPRLVEQLVLVNRISRILFDNRVKAIDSVERDVFEGSTAEVAAAAPPPAGRPGGRRPRPTPPTAGKTTLVNKNPGVVPKGKLFGKYRFVIDFSAKERALIGVLNALAKTPSFTVVKVMRLNKDVPVLMPVMAATTETGGAFAGLNRNQDEAAPALRLGPNYPVSGVEMEIPMDVRIELDVYKFEGESDGSGD